MKKLIILGACLLALAWQPARAQTGGAEVVVVRILEYNSRDMRIIVSYGEGKSEVVTLKITPNAEGQSTINEACQKTMQKLYREGYVFKSAYSVGPYTHGFIFIKGQ